MGLTIQDIQMRQKGEAVPEIEGTLIWAGDWKANTVNTPQGPKPSSFQPFTLRQGTLEIRGAAFGKGDLSEHIGSAIAIGCYSGQRGLSGLVVDEYNGTKQLKMTQTGTIRVLNGAPGGQQPPPAAAASSAQQPPPAGGAAPAAARTQAPASGPDHPKILLNRMANWYLACMVAADYVERTRQTMGYETTPEQKQGAASTFFIEGARKGLIDQTATGPFKAPKKGSEGDDEAAAQAEAQAKAAAEEAARKAAEEEAARQQAEAEDRRRRQEAESQPEYLQGDDDDDVPF